MVLYIAEEFLEDKGHFTMVVKVMIVEMMIKNYIENIEESFADVLQNKYSQKFRKFHRKTPVLEFLFNKVAGPKACNFIKNFFHHRYFPMKFAKFLRTAYFTEHLRWLPLKIINSSRYLRVLPI